jgi:hypothetical protein
MLGNDARASDLIEPLVAFDMSFLGDLDGGNFPRIHQHQLRLWGQAGDGATHRLQRCPVDVDAIDFTRPRDADRGSDRFIENGVGQFGANLRVEDLLGIVHPANRRFLGHDHGRCHNRTGEGCDPDLVHTRQRTNAARAIRRFPAAETPHDRDFAGLLGCASCLVAHDGAS